MGMTLQGEQSGPLSGGTNLDGGDSKNGKGTRVSKLPRANTLIRPAMGGKAKKHARGEEHGTFTHHLVRRENEKGPPQQDLLKVEGGMWGQGKKCQREGLNVGWCRNEREGCLPGFFRFPVVQTNQNDLENKGDPPPLGCPCLGDEGWEHAREGGWKEGV